MYIKKRTAYIFMSILTLIAIALTAYISTNHDLKKGVIKLISCVAILLYVLSGYIAATFGFLPDD